MGELQVGENGIRGASGLRVRPSKFSGSERWPTQGCPPARAAACLQTCTLLLCPAPAPGSTEGLVPASSSPAPGLHGLRPCQPPTPAPAGSGEQGHKEFFPEEPWLKGLQAEEAGAPPPEMGAVRIRGHMAGVGAHEREGEVRPLSVAPGCRPHPSP